MKVQRCPIENIDRFIQVIESQKYIYGMDVKELGIQDFNIQLMKSYRENDTLVPIELLDDDGTLLCISILYFAITQPTCIVRAGFITNEARKRYPAPTLVYNFVLYASDIIDMVESRCNDIFWLQRTGRARQMMHMYNNMDLVHRFTNKYEIRIAEEIPAYTKSNNPLFGKYLLGEMDGRCHKPLSIVNLYRAN